MQFTVATLAALGAVASASASADPKVRILHGHYWNCGVIGGACGKRELMNLVEARNTAELKRAEHYFKGVEARTANADPNADPKVRILHGHYWNCGVIGGACGKRDLEYLGILERNADPKVRILHGHYWNCGVIGGACGKREVMEKIQARNAARLAKAESIIDARNAEAEAHPVSARNADPKVRILHGHYWNCGVIGGACGKRDLEELGVLTPDQEAETEADEE